MFSLFSCFLVFFFSFAKNNLCVKARRVGAPCCCVPAIAWDACAPANCIFQKTRVKVAGIKNVRPGKKEKGEEESIKGGNVHQLQRETSPLEFAGCRISNFKNSRDEQGVWVCCVNILVVATVQVPFKTVHVLRATSTCTGTRCTVYHIRYRYMYTPHM